MIMLVLLCIFSFEVVHGEEINVDNILKYFKTNIYESENDEFTKEFYETMIDKVDFTINDNTITIKDPTGNITRKISLNNNLLTYYGNEKYQDKEYRENSANWENALGDFLIDGFYINQLDYAAFRILGYNDEDYNKFVELIDNYSENDDLEVIKKLSDYGVTMISEDYHHEESDESGSLNMDLTFILSYQINLEKFDVKKMIASLEQENNLSNVDNKNNQIENPKTGYFLPYFLIPISFLILFLYKAHLKRNNLYKI